MFCETTTPEGTPCPLDAIANASSFSGNSNITPEQINNMTVSEVLDLLEQALSIVKSGDWSSIYSSLIEAGFGSDPAYQDALNMILRFAAGDFSELDAAVDTVTTSLNEQLGGLNLAVHGDLKFGDVFSDVTEAPVELPLENKLLESWFDVDKYLAANPDLKSAAEAGLLNAVEHFNQFGFNEGRKIDFDDMSFNEAIYLNNNADIKAAVDAGHFSSGREHFDLFGQKEARIFSESTQDFSEDDYLAINSDVASAISDGAFENAFDHYKQFGQEEGRSHSALDLIVDGIETAIETAFTSTDSTIDNRLLDIFVDRTINRFEDAFTPSFEDFLPLPEPISRIKDAIDRATGLFNVQTEFVDEAFAAIESEDVGVIENFWNKFVPKYQSDLVDLL